MAEQKSDVKASGGGTSPTQVAVVTALIGAAATITVALINKAGSKSDPAPSPTASQAATAAATTANTLVDPSAAAPQATSEPMALADVAPQVANIAGTWRSSDGESIEIGQSGSSLTVTGATLTEAGPIMAAGSGRIDGRDVSWVMQLAIQGNQIEADCRGRLTAAGNSLQGSCGVMGERIPFLYNR